MRRTVYLALALLASTPLPSGAEEATAASPDPGDRCAAPDSRIDPSAFVPSIRPTRAFIGMRTTVSEVDGRTFLRVIEVLPDGPASARGLKVDDLIVSLDGRPVDFESDLDRVYFMDRFEAGDQLTFGILRGERELSLTVRAEAMAEPMQERLLKWVEIAEERIASGRALYCREEKRNDEVFDPLAELLANAPADTIVIRATRLDASNFRISVFPDSINPPLPLSAEDLEDFAAERIEGLATGRSLDLVFRSVSEGKWAVEIDSGGRSVPATGDLEDGSSP